MAMQQSNIYLAKAIVVASEMVGRYFPT